MEIINLNEQIVNAFEESLHQLDLSSLESSVYILKVSDEEGKMNTKKFIKLRTLK